MQINNLDALEKAVGNDQKQYWNVQNGYTFNTDPQNLHDLTKWLSEKNSEEIDYLLGEIKIGLHKDVVGKSLNS